MAQSQDYCDKAAVLGAAIGASGEGGGTDLFVLRGRRDPHLLGHMDRGAES